MKAEGVKKVNGIDVHLLSPTQSVMDRLAAWYHWNDRRSLLQAVDIVKVNQVDFNELKKWSDEEGEADMYKLFIKQIDIDL